MRATRLLAGLSFALVLLAGCGGGGDDGGASTRPASTGGTGGGPEVTADSPVTKYAPFVEELSSLGSFEVYPPETFGLAAATWSLTGPFVSATEGEQKAADWGYQEGFNVQYNPQGLLAGVLQGRYYITIQVHLFETKDGAVSAFEAYKTTTTGAAGAKELSPKGLGNEWVASELPQGVVGSSDVVAIYHRFVFRRGNVVATVQTYGAEPFMTIDPAREVAVMIDDRILGNTPAVEPTPIPPPVQPGTGS